MGTSGECNPKDLEVLKERCGIIFNADPDQYMSDASITRFLKGFKTVDDAFSGILKCNKWRKEFGVEKLTAEDADVRIELETKKGEVLRHRDRYGRPIILMRVRHHNVNDERNEDALTKFMVYLLETACKKCHEDVMDNICVIFDMQGFSKQCMDYTFVKTLIWLLSHRYPERLGVCLLINSPMVFQGCWTVIKPWLSEVTADKVKFISDEMQIANYLCPDALPDNMFEE